VKNTEVTMNTGFKLDARGVEKEAGKRSELGRPDVSSELRWLYQRIEELGAAIAGQRPACEISNKREDIIRLASEASGTLFYDLDLESGRFRMIFGLREKLGFDPEEVDLTRDWWLDQVHPEDRQLVRTQYEKALAKGGCRLSYRVRRKDGSYISVEDATRTSGSGSGPAKSMVGCIVDAVGRDAAGEGHGIPLRECNTEAEDRWKRHAQRLESINRDLQNFASMASHNLLDPLRKIRVFGEMMAAKWGESKEAPRYLARMQNAALRMQGLLEALQLYCRIDLGPISFSEVDLGVLVKEILSSHKERIMETAAEVEIGALPIVKGDTQQITILFQNLIGNGLKFHSEHKSPRIRIHVSPESECLPGEPDAFTIKVTDNGIGFEERYVERIFSPFHILHARDEYDGIGMGLAICRKIVERHGCRIFAKSTVGRGSTFTVTFPKEKGET
jgi:signal transduction histidine kinase